MYSYRFLILNGYFPRRVVNGEGKRSTIKTKVLLLLQQKGS